MAQLYASSNRNHGTAKEKGDKKNKAKKENPDKKLRWTGGRAGWQAMVVGGGW